MKDNIKVGDYVYITSFAEVYRAFGKSNEPSWDKLELLKKAHFSNFWKLWKVDTAARAGSVIITQGSNRFSLNPRGVRKHEHYKYIPEEARKRAYDRVLKNLKAKVEKEKALEEERQRAFKVNLEKVLLTILPKRRFSFCQTREIAGLGGSRSYTQTLMLHFPKITISNTAGLSRDLKDLYVAVRFSVSGHIHSELYGTRLTRSLEEICSNYTHSHLSGNTELGYFNEFCLGSGTPLRDILNSGRLENLDPLDWEMFIYSLKSMLEHESLDGVPYMYLRDIHPPKRGGEDIEIGATRLRESFKALGRLNFPGISVVQKDAYLNGGVECAFDDLTIGKALAPYVTQTQAYENGKFVPQVEKSTFAFKVYLKRKRALRSNSRPIPFNGEKRWGSIERPPTAGVLEKTEEIVVAHYNYVGHIKDEFEILTNAIINYDYATK